MKTTSLVPAEDLLRWGKEDGFAPQTTESPQRV